MTHTRSRRSPQVALALAVAASLGVGWLSVSGSGWWRWSAWRGHEPAGEWMAALTAGPTRPVAGRLSGSAYRPIEPAIRGEGRPSLSLDAQIAAARLQQLADSEPTSENRTAQAIALLYTGRVDEAVEVFEQLVADAPRNSALLNDLAVALLERAERTGSGQDWAAALDAAQRALSIEPRLAEAHFNSSLALEGLHLTRQALERRAAYREFESNPGWRGESEQRREALAGRHADAERARPMTDRQLIRERLEDVLLPQWGHLVVGEQLARAEEVLQDAERLLQAAPGGDRMAADEIALIRHLQAIEADRGLRNLANGHRLFGDARREYLRDNQAAAASLMTQAAHHFEDTPSPYGQWAPVYRSISLRNQGEARAAAAELASVPERSPHLHLQGRRDWALAVANAATGRYDLTLQFIARAVEAYRDAGEVDNLIATWTIKAEANWMLGNAPAAWQDLLGVLAQAARHGGTSRDYHYWIGSALSLADGLSLTALLLDDARVAAATSPRSKTEAHLNRARTRATAADREGALEDLRIAERLVASLGDPGIRERNQVDIRIARANVLVDTDPRSAMAEADAALQYVPIADPATRLADLLALRARCRQSLGDADGARADLMAAIDAFESKRQKLRSVHERTQAFERERRVFKQLVELEAANVDGAARSLAVAERSRAGALIEAWKGPALAADDPTRVRNQLSPGTAVVYYETLPDKTLVWVLTRKALSLLVQPVGVADLDRQVSEMSRQIARGATVTTIRPFSRAIVDDLIQPALARAGNPAIVFFVPDGPLHAVPFGALPDAAGRPLVARYQIGVTPSLTTFIAASREITGQPLDSVLAIGDGHDPAASGLPLLRWADREAADVGSTYPQSVVLRGAAATRRRIVAADPSVLHFAGHTVISDQFPSMSRMLLAPADDGGSWLVQDIVQHHFPRTRVVVLSSCQGAAGRVVAGEGAISIARAFFVAGVPSVVASLWPVDDDAFELMVTFHRQLRRHGNPAEALRVSQLAQMNSSARNEPIRRWGGFVAYGGARDALTLEAN